MTGSSRQVEPGADAGVERRLGEGDREPAVGDVVRERAARRGLDDEPHERCFGCEVEAGRRCRRRCRTAPAAPSPGSAGVPVEASRITSPSCQRAGDPPHVRNEPDAADDGGRMDRAAVGVVVERDVARDDRQAERLAGLRHPLDRLGELPADLGLLRVAEVEAVGEPERLAAGTGDVPRGLEDRRGAARERVERADPAGAVEREGEAAVRRPQPQHGGVEAGPANGARLDELVVAARHERARAERVRAEQVEQQLRGGGQLAERNLSASAAAARARRRSGDSPR